MSDAIVARNNVAINIVESVFHFINNVKTFSFITYMFILSDISHPASFTEFYLPFFPSIVVPNIEPIFLYPIFL